jgi:hypothetical protein
MNVRLKLCAVLVFFQAVSYFALQLTPRNDLYYFVAGLFSFLILPAIAKIGSYQEVIDVLFLALIMLGFQFIGGMIYHFDELEIPIWIYNGAIKILLALQFLRLLIIRKNDGVEQNNNFVYLLCRSNPKGSGNLC